MIFSIAFSTNPTKCKQDQKRPQGEKAGSLPGVLKQTGTNIAFGDVCRLSAAFSIMYLKFEHKAAPQPYLQWHIQHKRHTSQIIPFPLPDPHLWQFKLWSVDDENFDRLKIPATLNCLGFLESLPNAKSPSESSGWGLQKKQKTVSWSDDLQSRHFMFQSQSAFPGLLKNLLLGSM